MLSAKSANQQALRLLRKIGLDHADERTVHDVVSALRRAYSAGYRFGTSLTRPRVRVR